MKKSVLIVAILSVFAFSSCKDNAADKVNEENVATAEARDAESGKFPAITFEESQFDFGTIDQGTPVEHIFKFKNTGEAPLMIVNAKSSCGCTIPEYPKEPIAPGAEGQLLVKFNGSGQNQVSKTVTLTTNTKAGTETLTIKAFVTPKAGANAAPIKTPTS
ncbi:DUF1573 domain-containing protein [Vitellibacter sp. q18]|jgi:hypothetical protein|nr:DUF1573 domain-containing protein [Aequorivita lutea]